MTLLTNTTSDAAAAFDQCAQKKRRTGRKPWPRRARRGVSIFGVVLGVAVAAIVATGLVAAYNGVTNNVRAGAVQNSYVSAVANVRRTFASATTFAGGADSINAIVYSSAPSNFQNTSGSTRATGITFPYWGGTSQLIASTTTAEHTADRFTLHLVNIPPAVCEAVGATFVGDNSVAHIVADDTPLIATTGQRVAATGVDLADKCAEVGTDDLTDLKIQFRG